MLLFDYDPIVNIFLMRELSYVTFDNLLSLHRFDLSLLHDLIIFSLCCLIERISSNSNQRINDNIQGIYLSNKNSKNINMKIN